MADGPAEQLLTKLLGRWERRTEAGASRCVALSISGRDGADYFTTNGERREQLHATLRNAAQAGAVDLEWGRFEAAHELKRVVLKDGSALAAFLGRALAATAVNDLDERIELLLANAVHPWIADAYCQARTRWLRGLPALHLSAQDDSDDILRLVTALKAVSEGVHVGMDMRTFSARVLGDSKAMERLQTAFAQVWNEYHEQEPLDPVDLLATLGIEKAPQPVLLRGRLITGTTDVSALRPFVGLPGEALKTVQLKASPPYVLVVENLTSFQRHCREIDDKGLVIFSSGFPNPSVQSLLRLLSIKVPSSTPFFHWGDTDVRGVEIFHFIDSLCPSREARAHLMDRQPWLAERPVTSHELKVLNRIVDDGVPASALARRLIDDGVPRDFEQENFDPAPPCS